MMEIFASELLSSLPSSPPKSTIRITEGQSILQDKDEDGIGIDIAVIKLPYFADKAKSIDDSGFYAEAAQQVHLLGYDTLTRLLDTKYYPPEHTLKGLDPFLRKHRLLVTYRADDNWGGKEEQDAYLRDIEIGRREQEGARREWVSERRIRMVEGRREGEEVVSSTRVREAVKQGDRKGLEKLVTKGVGDWVLEEGLYLDD